MVSSQHQCPGVEGKVCNRFLPSKENDRHRLCVTCRVKLCTVDNRCEECHDWLDDRCKRVSENVLKLSLQHEKCKRKAKASPLLPKAFCPLCHCPCVSCHHLLVLVL